MIYFSITLPYGPSNLGTISLGCTVEEDVCNEFGHPTLGKFRKGHFGHFFFNLGFDACHTAGESTVSLQYLKVFIQN